MLIRDNLTTPEAAEYLRVSTRTMLRWRAHRTGPAWTSAGSQVRYRRTDLDEYLSARTMDPVADGGRAA